MLHLSVPEADTQPADFFSSGESCFRSIGPQPAPLLEVLPVAEAELVVLRKDRPGLAADQVVQVQSILRDIRQDRLGPCKFLVFEVGGLADATPAASVPGALLDEIADLVVDLPIIPVAWARGPVGAVDLELALACSMLVAEPDARFSFDLDLVQSLRTYAVLAHKIGFARAERLMEGAAELTAAQMSDLLLLSAVIPSVDGLGAIVEFARSRARRHNAACGIYRAQRRALTRG